MTKRIVLGVTGASGGVYALRLAEVLAGRGDVELHVTVTDAARRVLAIEHGAGVATFSALGARVHDAEDMAAPVASGSFRHDGMIVCPCSMASLAAIAGGVGSSLVHRAADVCLKERRPLVLVVRETPLNRVHLENMLRAHDAGAIIMPACPGFYHRPQHAQDLIDHLVGRMLDQLGLENDLFARWGENT